MDIPAQAERKFTLSLPFCSVQTQCGLDAAAHIGEGGSLHSVKCLSLLETLSQTQGEAMFYLPTTWASLTSITLTRNMNHQTILLFSAIIFIIFSLHSLCLPPFSADEEITCHTQ